VKKYPYSLIITVYVRISHSGIENDQQSPSEIILSRLRKIQGHIIRFINLYQLMFMRISTIFLTLLLTLNLAAHSQQSGRLSGKITNSRSVPVAASTIHLLNTNQGTVSDEKGSFEFKNLPAGKYILQVSSVGYATIDMDVTIGDKANESLNIQLTDAGKQLDGVLLVTAQKQKSCAKSSVQYYGHLIAAGTTISFVEYQRAHRHCSQFIFFQFRR
jgi:hypothetical protein